MPFILSDRERASEGMLLAGWLGVGGQACLCRGPAAHAAGSLPPLPHPILKSAAPSSQRAGGRKA